MDLACAFGAGSPAHRTGKKKFLRKKSLSLFSTVKQEKERDRNT